MNQTIVTRFDFDPAFPADQSVVLRYAPVLPAPELARDDLAVTSQQEGLRLIDLAAYRGVRLSLLDETTCTKTGTYKSLDGCITTALCRKLGVTRVVFSSGANAGIALTDYGAKTCLETVFFCPTGGLFKLDDRLFARPGAHLIAVEGPDRRVKEAARQFADLTGAPLVPSFEWRILSAACRGLFLAEQMLRFGRRFTWFTQALCAGYGPIGIYRVLQTLASARQLEGDWIPRLLGIQQKGLSPMVSAWKAGRSTLPPLTSTMWEESPIEPSLYNVYPDETYPHLYAMLKGCNGDMMSVESAEFERYVGDYTDLLSEAGVSLTTISVDGREQYLEKAGLLAGAGALKAIAEGRIRRGQTVLCALTGGAFPAPKLARPDNCIRAGDCLEDAVQRCARDISARTVTPML